MKREELLRTKEYWLIKIQNDLFNTIEDYIRINHLNKSQLAEKLGVTKGYITQILNGDFDHKISKLVELSLACNAMPLLYFTNADKYIFDDSHDKHYELIPINKPVSITFSVPPIQKIEPPVSLLPISQKQISENRDYELVA